MIERWRPVAGYEGLYEVSDLGHVHSLDRTVITRAGPRRYRGKPLRPCLVRGGYPAITLSKPGQPQEERFVHHLVLETFVGPRPDGQEARHGPAGKLDASVPNLCWGTRKENMRDKLRDGTDNRGEKYGGVKLTAAAVADIRTRWAAGERQTDLGREYGVTGANIWAIVHDKSWHYPS